MLKKIGLSITVFFLIAGLTSWATTVPQSPTFIVETNKNIKIEVPDYKPFKVNGLASVNCQRGTCTMSEEDFRVNQNDKWNLLQVYKLNHLKEVVRIDAFNSLVDAYSHSELAIAKKELAIHHLEKELRTERTYNALKTWLERLLFISGVVVFGSL